MQAESLIVTLSPSSGWAWASRVCECECAWRLWSVHGDGVSVEPLVWGVGVFPGGGGVLLCVEIKGSCLVRGALCEDGSPFPGTQGFPRSNEGTFPKGPRAWL